jgi:two-component system, cell cycle response regulator
LAERIRVAVESATHIVGERTIRMTVSIGVAFLNDGTSDLAGLLKAADQALYRAKAAGRNRVESSSPVAERAPDNRSGEKLSRSAA